MMKEKIEKIESWFKNGDLVRPGDDVDIVHVSRALASLGGVNSSSNDEKTSQMKFMIGEYDHYVFILLDGFGMNLLEKLDEKSFLRSNLKRKINSVFPSTTATVLTSFATGNWACDHSIPGWWIYLQKFDKVLAPILFLERDSERVPDCFGIYPDDLYELPGLFSDYNYDVTSYLPEQIVSSVYSSYLRNGTDAYGYSCVEDGLTKLLSKQKKSSNSFSYFYYPGIDKLSHEHGVFDNFVINLLNKLDNDIEKFAAKLPTNTRLIVTADHGLIDVPAENHNLIIKGDPLLSFLKVPPTGEPRVPIFHVLPDKIDAFVKYFENRFPDFTLINQSIINQLKLYGPHNLSSCMSERVGDFIAISNCPNNLYYAESIEKAHQYKGYHAGLIKGEVEVPLILFSN